jgi:thiosulfate dehydrogenase [quinone] large subunit
MDRLQRGRAIVQRWRRRRVLEDPAFARVLLNDSRFAILWLPLRVWLGSIWLGGAFTKLGDPEWMGSGETMRQFLLSASVQAGEAWYRELLGQLLASGAYVWAAKLVAFGELAVGLGLIVGAFTGLAAFFGAFMNFNFLLAASTGPDPMMFVAAIALILAWKTAGYWGADYFLLPLIGTPWGHHEAEIDAAARRRAATRRRWAVRAVTAVSVGFLALIAFSTLGPIGTQAAPPAPVDGPATVSMGGVDFRPVAITVRAGATVTWTNPSRVAHTVTAGVQPRPSGPFDSGLLRPGEEFAHTFEALGAFPYYCAYHPGMVGTVTVVP